MDIIKAPQADISNYLYNVFNINLYEDLYSSDESDCLQLITPLEFFNLLYTQFEYFEQNANRYLDIKKHFSELDLDPELQFTLLDSLTQLIINAFGLDKFKENGVFAKSFQFLANLRDDIFNKLNDIKVELKKKIWFDFSSHKLVADSIPLATEKIVFWLDARATFLQTERSKLFNAGVEEIPFDKKCNVEIEKLKEVLQLEAMQEKRFNELIRPSFNVVDEIELPVSTIHDDTEEKDLLMDTIVEYMDEVKKIFNTASEFNEAVTRIHHFFKGTRLTKIKAPIFTRKGSTKKLAYTIGQLYRAQTTLPISRDLLKFLKSNFLILNDQDIDTLPLTATSLYKYCITKPQ